MTKEKVFEGGLTELIGTTDALTQYDYSDSIAFTLPRHDPSGEILDVILTSVGGAIQKPAGKLLFFNADPGITAGDTSLSTASNIWNTVLGVIPVAVSDWVSDVTGAVAHIADKPIAFNNLQTLYAAFLLQSTGAINNATGDLEVISLNPKFRLEG